MAASTVDNGTTAVSELAFRIRQKRLQRSLSVSELARLSGIDKSNISRIESGRHAPSLETIQRLADAMSLKLADFFGVVLHPYNLKDVGGPNSGPEGYCDYCGVTMESVRGDSTCEVCGRGKFYSLYKQGIVPLHSKEEEVRLGLVTSSEKSGYYQVRTADFAPTLLNTDIILVAWDVPTFAGDLMLAFVDSVMVPFRHVEMASGQLAIMPLGPASSTATPRIIGPIIELRRARFTFGRSLTK